MTQAKPRELETRAIQELTKKWMPPELLPEPDRQPGFAYRWIRVSTLGNADPGNVSSKTREGWEPVALEEQPRLALLADPNGRYAGNIEHGGLLLCKMPEEFVEQRNAHYNSQAANAMRTVDNSLMRESDPRMPIFKQSESKVTFGKGT